MVDSDFSSVPKVSKSLDSQGLKKKSTMTQYRYQLERYRGRSTRHVCPQCGRKNVFTRYIDTYNNNIYINDIVGKCNRIDKCDYHYQYFSDNPWKRDNSPGEDKFSNFQKHRDFEKLKIENPSECNEGTTR